MHTEAAGWAILFAVPVGVGVAMAILETLGTLSALPLAVGAGLIAALGVFLIVYIGGRTGETPNQSPEE